MDPRHPNNLYDLRVARKWSQKELAEKIGMTGPMISCIEIGKRTPHLNTILLLLDVFDCGFRDIFPRNQPASNQTQPPELPLTFENTPQDDPTPQPDDKPSQNASNAVLAAQTNLPTATEC